MLAAWLDPSLDEQDHFRISFDNPAVNEATRDVFIASFSEKGDDLGQWRACGNQGAGYAIGMSFVVGEPGDEPQDQVLGTLLPCEYDRAQALGDFKADLLEVLGKFERYAVTYHAETGFASLPTTFSVACELFGAASQRPRS